MQMIHHRHLQSLNNQLEQLDHEGLRRPLNLISRMSSPRLQMRVMTAVHAKGDFELVGRKRMTVRMHMNLLVRRRKLPEEVVVGKVDEGVEEKGEGGGRSDERR